MKAKSPVLSAIRADTSLSRPLWTALLSCGRQRALPATRKKRATAGSRQPGSAPLSWTTTTSAVLPAASLGIAEENERNQRTDDNRGD